MAVSEWQRLRRPYLWQALAWLQVGIVVWLELTPSPPTPPDFLAWDKAQHCLAYAGLAWWFGQCFKRGWHWPLFLITLGVALEFLQGWGGVRTFDVDDMLANALGVAIGTALAVSPLGRLIAWLDRRLPAAA